MQQETDRERFRALFSELKDEDRRASPSFDRVWQEASGRHAKARPPAIRGWRVAAAVVALAAGGGLAAFLVTAPRRGWVSVSPTHQFSAPSATQTSTVAEPASSLTDWRSPTEFLLELAADESSSSPSPDRAAEPIPTQQNF